MKTAQLAHDLVTDVVHTLVPDLLLAQQVRDYAEADEEEIVRLRANNSALIEALAFAEDALSYAVGKLNNPTINGHRVLAQRLAETRAAIAKATSEQP